MHAASVTGLILHEIEKSWPHDKDERSGEQLHWLSRFQWYLEAHNWRTAIREIIRSDSNAQDAYAVAVMHDTGTQSAMTWIITFSSL